MKDYNEVVTEIGGRNGRGLMNEYMGGSNSCSVWAVTDGADLIAFIYGYTKEEVARDLWYAALNAEPDLARPFNMTVDRMGEILEQMRD